MHKSSGAKLNIFSNGCIGKIIIRKINFKFTGFLLECFMAENKASMRFIEDKYSTLKPALFAIISSDSLLYKCK